MNQNAKIGTPVIRNLRSLFREPLPRGPVIVHMAEQEWKKLSKGIQISKRKIRKGAKGMFVTPDPFGQYLGFFACAAKSGEGVACVPEIIRSGGTITFGSRCLCFRGRDTVERDPGSEPKPCSMSISVPGRVTCSGGCRGIKSCKLIKVPTSVPGQHFITCECS